MRRTTSGIKLPHKMAGGTIMRALVLATTLVLGAAAPSTTRCSTGMAINPSSDADTFLNGGMNGTLVPSGNNTFTISGWTFYNERVQLNGNSVVAGFPTPTDTNIPPLCPCPNDNCTLVAESYTTQLSNTAPPPGASSYADMDSVLTSQLGYAIAHGPYMVSATSVALKAGSVVSFDWRANQGGDAYDVFAYLLRTDSGGAGNTIELLNEVGGNGVWQTKTVSIPTAGSYTFVFMSGSYDQSGGLALGASLEITNVLITGNYAITSLDDCVDACLASDNATTFVNYDSANNDCACSSTFTSYNQTSATTGAFAIDPVRLSAA